MNPFKFSKEVQDEQLFDAVRAQYFAGRKGVPAVTKFFTRKFESASASSMLEIYVEFKVGRDVVIEHRGLARKVVSGLNPIPALAQHMAATFVAELYRPHAMPKTWVHQYKRRISPASGNEEYIREILPIHRMLPGEHYIHFQELHRNAVSLFSYLQALGKRKRLTQQDKQVLDLVSAELHRLHSIRDIPVSLKDRDILSLDSLDRGLLDDAYDDALVAWQAHFLNYRRPRAKKKGPHPVWTKELRERFLDTMEKFADRFAARGDRLVITHGDLWSPNILLIYENGVYSDVEFVDQYRIPYFDRGFDLGRLLFDGIYWYYSTKKPIYLEWNNNLMTIHQKRSGDEELRETVCFGLISRLFSKLHPESARDFNTERILWLCNVILTMAKQRRYELRAP